MASISYGHANSGLQVGVNQGSIYVSREQSEPRPEPLSTVPFPRDPDFVGRNEILEQIHEKASIAGSRLALVGLGGVGKTQLAIEYCRQVRQQSADTWIFWVHASNAARCEKSLRDLADRAKIPGRQDCNGNIFQLVGNWLKDGKIGKWILVLDNVDDDELLWNPSITGTGTLANGQSHASTQPPLRYLLESSNGSIIITSRNKGVALHIAGHTKNIIDVQPMNVAEALVLLQNKLDIHTESADMVQLVEELELMPLAIVQAASYIIHHSPRFSVSQYLEMFRGSDHRAIRLLSREAAVMDRDWEAKNSIILTWQISFDYIRKKRRSAADLLSLMSFFDWQGIPENLLRVHEGARYYNNLSSPQEVANGSSGEDTDRSSESDLDHDFEDDIATLRNYSFIYIAEYGTIFTMHRLVQLTARAWLKTQGQTEQWKKQFIRILYKEFPTGVYKNWATCRKLFPHVKSAMSQRPESYNAQRRWAMLLCRGAEHAWHTGNVSDAREMAFKSREQREILFGPDDVQTLHSTHVLAIVYWLEGRWDDAEQLNLQVMETRKMKLGEDHPHTLTSMANLAATYRKQGRWEVAEQLQVRVMETRKRTRGEDHHRTLSSMANLAATYRNQGRWEKAEKLDVHVVETRKRTLGEDHPDTLSSIDNLASTYWNQGRLDKAEQLFLQVIKTRKTKLGEDNIYTMTTIHNLASTYSDQGRLEEAEQLFLQVIEIRKTKIGEDHPDTLTSMSNLALLYVDQGRWEEAEQLNLEVMESRKMKLGEDHPDTLTSMANLAATYRNQGRWGAAEKLEVQVMETSKAKLGEDHPDTLRSMANLAFTFESTGRHYEAIDLLRTCVTEQQRILGPAHPRTVYNSDTLLAWETEDLAIKT